MRNDVELDYYIISKALTRKVLIFGVEKYYLKYVSIPFLVILGIMGPALNTPIIVGLIVNFLIIIMLGRFLAKKNPFWVEMAMRHMGYKKFYLSQGKYSLRHDKPWYRGTKGHRTYESVNRND